MRRLEEDAIKLERLRENVSLLQDELDNEKAKLADLTAKQTVRANVRSNVYLEV